MLDGALNARVQLPGKKLSPYATVGVGGYTLFLDVQANRGERHKVGLSFNAGAGVLYQLSERAGLTLDVRSATFTERNPVPTGVVIGALMHVFVARIDASTSSGNGVPRDAITSTPASTSRQSNCTPVASNTSLVTCASSGPVPSPRMRVTG